MEGATNTNQDFQLTQMTKTVSEHISSFALDLYKHCSKNYPEDRNIFLSPFSIHSVLAMTTAGARGNTALQAKSAMHLDNISQDDNQIYQSIRDIQSAVRNNEIQATINVANRMFVHNSCPILQEYTKFVNDYFSSDVAILNGHEEINEWVERETNNKIKDLLSSSDITTETKLVLVNAIYFKADWDKKFQSSLTKGQEFIVADGSKIPVQMMFQKGSFLYRDDSEHSCQILEIPYVNKRLRMTIILPNTTDGLQRLEENITNEEILRSLINRVAPTNVNLSFPKFKLAESYNMIEILKSLGITDLFTPKADLSGITGSTDLYVAVAKHQAVIEVNEEGSEAAAATAMVANRRSAPMPRKEINFVADHPFLFVIRDKAAAGTILFIGSVKKPSPQ